MNPIFIKGIPKAHLLAALVNGTRSRGMGVLQDRGPMTIERAQGWIDAGKTHDQEGTGYNPELYFDYVEGRPIKCSIAGDVLNARLYDRDAGTGAAERIVELLRDRFPVLPEPSEEGAAK